MEYSNLMFVLLKSFLQTQQFILQSQQYKHTYIECYKYRFLRGKQIQYNKMFG